MLVIEPGRDQLPATFSCPRLPWRNSKVTTSAKQPKCKLIAFIALVIISRLISVLLLPLKRQQTLYGITTIWQAGNCSRWNSSKSLRDKLLNRRFPCFYVSPDFCKIHGRNLTSYEASFIKSQLKRLFLYKLLIFKLSIILDKRKILLLQRPGLYLYVRNQPPFPNGIHNFH